MQFGLFTRALVLGVATTGAAFAQNDECAGALPLALGATPFDNTLATTSPEAFPCGGSLPLDLWYTITPSAAGSIITVDTFGSGFDTRLEILSGTCGALTSIECNDDFVGFESQVTAVAPDTNPLYVRVAGFNSAVGTGVLNVGEMAPPPPPVIEVAITDCLPGTFIDISATGTALNIDDDGEVDITTTVGNALLAAGVARVGSNGGVRFAGSGQDLAFSNAALPSTAFTPGQVLFPFWDDFDTELGLWGNILWEEIGGTLIIQWDNASFYQGGATQDRATFQVQVHSSGPAFAQFLYSDIESVRASGGASATIGYQNGVGPASNDVQYSFNANAAVHNGTVLSLVDKSLSSVVITDTLPGTFIDISATGTSLMLSDDGEADITTTVGNGLLAAGIARVGSNGGVRFAGAGADLAFSNATIPSTGAFVLDQALLPFWDDFNTAGGTIGDILWQEIGDTLIIQWNQAGFFGAASAGQFATFQVQVFAAGGPVVAQYLYQDIEQVRPNGGESATIGYQAGGIGSDATWSFDTAGAVSDGTVLSICYTDALVGTKYCTPVANSTGKTGNMFGTGSASLAANDLVLNVTDLPLNAFGFFVRGTTTANTLLAGGGQGTLCVGGTTARGVGGSVVTSGATGSVSILADLTALPSASGPVSATVGQTLWLQFWHRDFVGGMATSNLSNALQVQVGM